MRELIDFSEAYRKVSIFYYIPYAAFYAKCKSKNIPFLFDIK